ncbi:MAG TPA: hypothetical protein VFB42_03375 [Gaiellaceae bacterium]|nr:hypothetical protein [Gaiellaceae bacterium]
MPIRGLAIIGAVAALAGPAAASAAGILFAPRSLPAATVGVRYQAVIRISLGGHHPALGLDYPSYTVACYGATPDGRFIDDCSKLPPGLRLRHFEGAGCAPPLTRPDCIVLAGTPRKAGRFSFRISAPDPRSAGVRGILRRYTVVVRPSA